MCGEWSGKIVMNSIEEVVGLFQVGASVFSDDALKKAQVVLAQVVQKGDVILSNIRVPVLTDDEQVRKCVEKYNLNNPKNMIRFFVEASFATIEQIHDTYIASEEQKLQETISKIDSAKRKIIHGIDNPQEMRDKFIAAQNAMFDVAAELEEKFKSYVEEIRVVDNMPKKQSFFKAHLLIKKVDSADQSAKKIIDALIKIIGIQTMVANQLGQNISNSVVIPFQNFVQESILKGNTCDLLHAYDSDKENEFWHRIPEKIDTVGVFPKQLEDFSSQFDEEDEEIDFN